jgi:hypothetical protein
MANVQSLPFLLKELRLTTMAKQWQAVSQKAIEMDWEPELFLAHLCELETSYRHDNKLKRLLRESKLPIGKQLAQYDFSEITGVTAQQIKQKTTQLDWLKQGHNVLLFGASGLLEDHDVENMKTWNGSGGFSVNGTARVHENDREGLERLLRYCARPPFALERIKQQPGGSLIYQLKKPLPNGQTLLKLTSLELIDKLAELVPPPRIHRHRYYGVLAPNSPFRASALYSNTFRLMDNFTLNLINQIEKQEI